jgi:glycerophosphoryl diester phosphodiesterase
VSTNPAAYRTIVRVGHRGAAGHAPENTLGAIERGIALGVEFLEIDLQRTRDGRIVVMHDKFVDRTTNGRGRVAALTWDELRVLDAGAGERIPLLEEVLDAASGRTGLILECITPELGADIWHTVASFGFRGPMIFASFLHLEIRTIRELDPQVMTMALLEGVPITPAAFALDAGATHAGLALDSTTPQMVNALHEARVSVFVYTPDTAEQIELAVQLGTDGIISNFPERLPRQGYDCR